MPFKYNPLSHTFDIVSTGGGGGGNVTGPGSSTDSAIALFDGTSGQLLKNSLVTIDGSGNITANSINLTTPLPVIDGGTGLNTLTTGDIYYASGANTLAKLAIGSASQVLTVSGGIPSWATPASSGVTSVTGTLNRITSTGGATPVIDISASYVGQSSITTLGTIVTGVWTGTSIALANGGTNANLTASNGGIFYSTASAGAILSGTATAGQLLTSGASTTPSWTTSTYPLTNAISTLLYASSSNVMAALATANNGLLVTGSSGIPSILAGPGATGKVLQSNSAAAPSFSTATYPATATGTGTILRADGTNWSASTATYPNTAASGDIIVASGSNVFGNLSVPGLAGCPVIYDGTGVAYFNPANYSFLYDDFVGTLIPGNVGWREADANGSGLGAKDGTASHPGIAYIQTGTSTNGTVNICLGPNSTTGWAYLIGTGALTQEWMVQLSALSNGTDTYIVRLGIQNAGSQTPIESDGIYFFYNDTGALPNWYGVTRKANTNTQTDTSTAASTGWTRLKIVVNAAGTSVGFYINGSLVATNTTNIPTTQAIGPQFGMTKSAGTTNRLMLVDYMWTFMVLTTPR